MRHIMCFYLLTLILSVSSHSMYTSSCQSILQYLTFYVVYMCVVFIFKFSNFLVLFCVFLFTAHQYLLSMMSGSSLIPNTVTWKILVLCLTNTFSVFIAHDKISTNLFSWNTRLKVDLSFKFLRITTRCHQRHISTIVLVRSKEHFSHIKQAVGHSGIKTADQIILCNWKSMNHYSKCSHSHFLSRSIAIKVVHKQHLFVHEQFAYWSYVGLCCMSRYFPIYTVIC